MLLETNTEKVDKWSQTLFSWATGSGREGDTSIQEKKKLNMTAPKRPLVPPSPPPRAKQPTVYPQAPPPVLIKWPIQ